MAEYFIHTIGHQKCGTIDITYIETKEDARTKVGMFYHSSEGVDHYLKQITCDHPFPIYILNKITLDEEYRKEGKYGGGIGSAVVIKILEVFRMRGSKAAFLAIGKDDIDEDWEIGKKWRVNWYNSLGWKLLPPPDQHPMLHYDPEDSPPKMWHDLTSVNTTKKLPEVTLELIPQGAFIPIKKIEP